MKDKIEFIVEVISYWMILFIGVYLISLGLINNNSLLILIGSFIILAFSISLNIRFRLG